MRTVALTREDGTVVCEHCLLAEKLWARMRGLLGRSQLEPGAGMLISRTGSVHTFFMRFPIDVVFLDAELVVVGIRADLGAWRMALQRRAKYALELPAGQAARRGLVVGTRLARQV
jgi:uncharacterized membrane protein (UPF0127 family)